jgi:hypothetical protein
MPPVDSNLRVGVIHGPGSRLTSVWFDLKRRKHTIREITNVWRDRQGEVAQPAFQSGATATFPGRTTAILAGRSQSLRQRSLR